MLDLTDLGPAAHAKTGEACGVRYCLRNGLLDVQLQPHQAIDLLEFFKQRMKVLARDDQNVPSQFMWIHRYARMSYELVTGSRITGIDKLEAEFLYDAPQEEKFEWIFKILNGLRDQIRATECSIVVADHVAKSIEDIMTS